MREYRLCQLTKRHRAKGSFGSRELEGCTGIVFGIKLFKIGRRSGK